jgi:hypothetical protein
MNALSSTEFKVDDLDGELQFTISRETGWVEVVLFSTVVSAFGVYGILENSVFILFASMVGIGTLLINWAMGPTTVFRISANRAVATGNLHRWSSSDINIPASEIKSIGWSSGGENNPNGIYVWHGLKGTCVLPGLPKKKAKEVTDAIAARFPQFTIGNGASISWSIGVGG